MKVPIFAILTRIAVLILAIVSEIVIEKYDTSNNDSESSSWWCQAFTNWDGVHFANVALYGYQYEKSHAFFPFLPWLVRTVAQYIIRPLIQCSMHSAVVVSSFGISNASFVLAACALHRLSMRFVGKREAYIASLLFCLNPASIFMSSFYTESIFAACSFVGMIFASQGRRYAASFMFSVCASTRSNGALLSIFFIALPSFLSFLTKGFKNLKRDIMMHLMPAVLPTCLPFLPFILFQAHASNLYCVSGGRPWCDFEIFGVSIGMYSWIQKEYWGNGVFSYWTLRQIPNFALASPMILICCYGIFSFFYKKNFFCTQKNNSKEIFTFCFRVHWILLFLIAFIGMNVQVITRFLSACPALYWYLSRVFLNSSCRRAKYFIIAYSLSYLFLGTVMFTGFYPWT